MSVEPLAFLSGKVLDGLMDSLLVQPLACQQVVSLDFLSVGWMGKVLE